LLLLHVREKSLQKLKDFKSAISRNPKDIMPRLGLAGFYLQAGQIDKELKHSMRF
jgi:hypothetical protein